MLNEYPAIRAESTIQNKFRTLRTYARLVAGVDIDKGYRNDINTVRIPLRYIREPKLTRGSLSEMPASGRA